MNKLTKVIVGIVIGYLAFVGFFSWVVYQFKWSIWAIFWAVVIPLIIGGVAFLVYKLRNMGGQKEDIDENKRVSKDEVETEAKKYIINNKDIANMPTSVIASIYVPPQQGLNKIAFWKVKCLLYWGGGVRYLATMTSKIDFEQSIYYEKDITDNERDFEKRLNNSVINPKEDIVIEESVSDPLTGQTRVVRSKKPYEYIKREQERKQAKEQAESEGAEDEAEE